MGAVLTIDNGRQGEAEMPVKMPLQKSRQKMTVAWTRMIVVEAERWLYSR